MSDLPDQLQPKPADYAATFLQVITGAVGGPAGAFFAAMIGHWIPGQLQERLVQYVAALSKAMKALGTDFEHMQQRMGSVEIDLFNLGAQVAGRSSSPERIEQVASVVARGLNEAETKAADADRLLRLLSDVSESDVAALCALAPTYSMATGWLARHPRAAAVYARHAPGVVRRHRSVADPDPTPDEIEAEVMIDFQLRRLEGLGLLARKPGNIPYGGKPPTPGPYQLTRLAAYVLDQLGVAIPADPNDRLRAIQQPGRP